MCAILAKPPPPPPPHFEKVIYTPGNAEVVLAAHRDLLPKGSVKHDAMSNGLLKVGMLPYHRTAAITACIIIIDKAIPLTRANRLAAIFTPFLRGPLRFTYALVVIG